MTISKKYAQTLVRSGAATIEQTEDGPVLVRAEDGHLYQLVTRHDVSRVDHYRVD